MRSGQTPGERQAGIPAERLGWVGEWRIDQPRGDVDAMPISVPAVRHQRELGKGRERGKWAGPETDDVLLR